MLVLSRRPGEGIVLDLRPQGLGTISFRVVEVRGNLVRTGWTAPTDIKIHRQEVFEAIEQQQRDSEHQHVR